jgi:DNA-damage-inducible protein J
MGTVQLATRVEKTQEQLFRETTRQLGTTPADAMRMFIAAFNQHRGFPFEVKLSFEVEPFETEEEAMEFITRKSRQMINATQ